MRGLGSRFTKFWLAASVSAAGDGLLVTGLPLLAREVSSSPFVLSLIFAASRVPWVFGLFAGAIVDRSDARRVMIRADSVRAALLGLLGFRLFAFDSLPTVGELTALGFALGAGAVVFFGAVQRAVPALVASADFDQANGYLESSNILGEQFVGPAIGGLTTTGKLPIVGDAVSFAVSAFVLRSLPPLPPEPGADQTAVRQQLRSGWRWFSGHSAIRGLTLVTAAVAALSTFVLATEVVIVRDTLGLPSYWLAPFTAAMAAGGIAGGLLASRVIHRFGESTFTLAVLASGICYLTCCGARSPAALMAALAIETFAVVVANVSASSIRQRAVPADLRGRVIGLARSLIFGAQVPGALIGGGIAQRYGTDVMFAIAGGCLLLIALGTARPLRRLLAPYQAPTLKAAA